MGLLEEIRDAAIDGSSGIGTALRKCLVLAAKLKNESLRTWVEKELNGYSPEDELPAYREFDVQSFGQFSGPWGSQGRNLGIPLGNLPDELRDSLRKARFQGPIANLETMVKEGKDRMSHWPTEVLALCGDRFYEGMNCIGAYQRIPVSMIGAVVETVRNRLLKFVLQIADETPEAADVEGEAAKVVSERVTQMFSTTIMGNVGNWSQASLGPVSQNFVNVQKGDVKSLAGYLRALGISRQDVDELEDAIDSDPPPAERGSLGPKVSDWFGKMVAKAASGGWDITAGAAGNLLSQAIWAYYGFGG